MACGGYGEANGRWEDAVRAAWGRHSWRPGQPQARMRASDSDREATASALREAAARGYLTLDELGDRLGAAYGAKHADELSPLLADIPAPVPARRPPPVAAGWRHPVVFAVLLLFLVSALASLSLHFAWWPLLIVMFVVARSRRSQRRRSLMP